MSKTKEPTLAERLKMGQRRYTYTPPNGKTVDIWCFPDEIKKKLEQLKKKEKK